MIAFEAKATELPEVEGAVRVQGLEARTGGDIFISPRQMPLVSEHLIQAHLDAGAVMIQVKFGHDLASSAGPRIAEALWRMCQWRCLPCQRRLLYGGTLFYDAEGRAVLQGHNTHSGMGFWAAYEAMARWNDRGGVVEPFLPSKSLLGQYCKYLERKLVEYASSPTREYYPAAIHVPAELVLQGGLQVLVKPESGKVLLAQLDGIGPELAGRIWEWCKGDMRLALQMLTDRETARMKNKPVGIGIGKIEQVRAQFHLRDEDAYLAPWPVEEVFHAIS